jgi:DNA-binding NtrC family response regulator
MVSRRHAALELTGLRLTITDLDSTNGTAVNDVSVANAFLNGGEIIRLGETSLRVELRASGAASEETAPAFGRLVGGSPRMRVVFAVCHRLAASDVPVVIEGETGTGKELVAECLHEASARASGPFVVFDCAATPRQTTEAALFGEREPARMGVFELANGGTLLLDEIGDLDLAVQGALLRVIERGELKRLGDERFTRVSVRTLAVTSRDLEKLVEAGRFREDLFFRLAVGRVDLPPLRRRPGDVPLLAQHFFRALTGSPTVPRDFYDRFQDYHWPGNVRELQNAVARFVALGPTASLVGQRARHAGAASRKKEPSGDVFSQVLEENLPFTQARQRVLDAFERVYVERLLAAHGGNVARAAAASGIARRYFQLLRARQR